ncbi:fimbrillin family protein [Barnesiella sp. ET7]|uniref:fimbrillin family protein n=1 Tax=Barnesiella sp. ET7 TaxID=2972460 RepID=UPI0021AD4661|nr:fimbrillin family protein [Barnesiella sp. ET7]MCR8912794.1 fimbrillin family protein [Barnesiella sp. ET7]
MKRTTIHISAALALLLGLAACTQDEAGFLPEGAEGTPIVFTATGLNPDATATAGTRAPVDGNWEGVSLVGVLMGGTVKAYDVTPTTADNTSATLTSDDPHYWTNHDNITVTAWCPYTEGETTPPAVVVRADQSSPTDFEGSDFISAENQPVSYGNPTLRFTHRTARVTVVLTDYTEERMFVRLTGLSTENGNPAVIAPYDKGGDTYTALVAPQSVATGTAFITCKFTNGKVFVYKMKNDAEWKAGEEYTYTVSLAAAKDPGYTIEGDGSYTVTTADGLKNVAKLVNEEGKTDINITLDTDLTLTGEWTPIGTESQPYTGTFDGGNHTITGLKIDQSGTDNVGLIGRLGSGGKVQDVTLTEVNVTGGTYVGGIAGQTDGTVENCSVNGTVTGQNQTGGIVGRNFSTISGCSAEGTVTGNTNVGGISGLCVPNYDTGTGSLIGSTIEGCHSTAAVSGISSVGGVVGNLGNGCSLMACYSTGNVTATITYGHANVGGVVGINGQGTVTACYHATGEITSSVGDRIGGIAGCNDQSTFTACYWENNQEQGTGSNNGKDDTHKVDGIVTWQTAVDAMNAALNGSGWQYELKDGNSLPTLKKEQ